MTFATSSLISLPAMIGIVAGLGANLRFYRTVMLDEIRSDYVRTAFAKGLTARTVLFKHVLKNAMIPIVTNVVLSIPYLILGSLLLERFFGIPGLGYLMIEAINDFAREHFTDARLLELDHEDTFPIGEIRQMCGEGLKVDPDEIFDQPGEDLVRRNEERAEHRAVHGRDATDHDHGDVLDREEQAEDRPGWRYPDRSSPPHPAEEPPSPARPAH